MQPENQAERNDLQADPEALKGPGENPVNVPEMATAPRPKGVLATFRDAFRRARENPTTGVLPTSAAGHGSTSDRSARNRDRTKTLFAMVAALVFILIAFLGLFSSSQTDGKRELAARRGQPSLGRPEDRALAQGRKSGSVTPLLSADLNANQEATGDQVSPEEVGGTARSKTGQFDPATAQKGVPKGGSQHALNNVQFDDPALEAYRKQVQASATPAPTSAPPAPPPTPPASANSESEVLAKPSLVYVKAASATGQAPAPNAPAFVEQNSGWDLLPTGTRLMARLQTAVSTAVKMPVVAVIETHYERNGEIVVPAGSKAFGELQSANRSGFVAIRFHSLQMPDGSTEKIDGGAVSLQFGPIKGQVAGTNRGKQFLARTLTGVGTVAAFAVGGSGGLSLSGPVDNSILLRERIAQNLGIAGEQELTNLSFNQDVVVTVPGNTRFYIVLQQAAGNQAARPSPPSATGASAQRLADASGQPLPSAAELRELIVLKQELDRLNRAAYATRFDAGTAPPPQ